MSQRMQSKKATISRLPHPPHFPDESFRFLVEHSSEGISLLDAEANILYVSRANQNIHGYPPEEVAGRNGFDFVHPDDRGRLRELWAECLRSPGNLFHAQYRLGHRDGSWRTVESTAVNRLDEPAVRAVVHNIRDVTDSKRAEARLREYERVVEGLDEMIVVVGRDYRYVLANRAFLQYRGLEEEEVIGRPVSEMLGRGVFDSAINEKLDECFKGTFVKFGLTYHHPTLGERDLSLSYYPIEVAGEVTGAACVLQDTTERKRAEAALRESEGRYRSLFQNMLEGWAHCRVLYEQGEPRDLIYLEVNDAFERLTGLKGVVGKRVSDVIPGFRESNPEALECYGRVASTGKPEKLEIYVEPLGIWFSIAVYCPRPGDFIALFDNITERKNAEIALRHSEERYRLLFYSNPQPMWVYDLETLRFLTVNQAAVDHYGYSPSEFLSLTLWDIRSPEDVPALERSVQEATGPLHKAGVWRHRTKFGRTIWVEITESRVEFEGKTAGLVLANDITDRKQVEDKVYLQAAALESAGNAIVITDTAGIIQWINSSFERLTGYSRDEVLGRTPRLLKSGRHDVAFYREMWETILAGRVWDGELINRRKDGSLYAEHQTITPVRGANGAVTNFVSIREDISGRRLAEEALRKSEAGYRSIIEGAPYGIYRVSDSGEVLMANPALAQMLGYDSAADLVGHSTARDFYLSPEDRERSVERWSDGEVVAPYEVTWKRKDGKHITVRLAGRLLQQADATTPSYEVFVEDTTQWRSLEEQLRRAQRMEAIGRLAGGIAHDFNNLLMIIGSCAQLLAESKHDPARTDKYSGQIRDAVNRAAELTRQLLAFSRQQVLELSILSLNSVVSELGKMLPRLLGEDIDLIVELDRDLGNVNVDRSQFEQVVMNLAVNARDAMPEGGKLTIETASIELDNGVTPKHGVEVPPGRYALLAVSDTGTGMDAGTMARIFEPFFTTKERGKGTGLGLSTVYGIVKQSGGFIWVYSEPGHGTTFKIYLPLTQTIEQAAPAIALPAEPSACGSETILLVEDEPALREVTRDYLQSKGYRVLEAGSGAEALEKCKKDRDVIDVLITDMVMPGMSGVDLAEAAREIRPDLPVIFVSGYTDRTVDSKALGAGAAFLQKPVSLEALNRKLRAVLEGRSANS